MRRMEGHLQAQQPAKWNYCVEIAIRLNESRQVAIIDECHFRRHAFWSRHGLYFALHLGLYLAVYLLFALHLA